MLDSHAHRYLQPVLDLIARRCLRMGVSANALTLAGLACGLLAAVAVASGAPILGVTLLWLSGLLDAAEMIVGREAAIAKALLAGTPIGQVMGADYEHMLH